MNAFTLTAQDCHNLKVLLTRTPVTGTAEARLLAVLDAKLEAHSKALESKHEEAPEIDLETALGE